MPVTVIIGAQWGDEGKGKIVDRLSREIDIVARYQGGANAGHTVSWGDKTVILHLIPSGIFHEDVTCVIGNGVVIDPVALLDELKVVRDEGFEPENRLLISHNAHLIMPYHKKLDAAKERYRESDAIGTTGRGIGPAYVDKVARTGIRVVDLLDRDTLRKKLKAATEETNLMLRSVYDAEELDVDAIVDEYATFDRMVDPFITNTSDYLNEALAEGKRVLAEGAQGVLLDVDFGTYPYVTSSNPSVGGCCTGLGIPPTAVERIIGISKAYCTRVGNGPFPTELSDEKGNELRRMGSEFGATTGRPRRCGWIDLVALRYAATINGMTELAITKMDVLTGLPEINVATAYNHKGKLLKRFPSETQTLVEVEPVYEALPGWSEDISAAETAADLPENAIQYLKFLSEFVGVPVNLVSVGPRRSQTISLLGHD